MGEIMRWRSARAPQRRVPTAENVVTLDGLFQVSAATLKNLQSLLVPRSPTVASYAQIFVDAPTVRQQLTSTSGNLAPTAQVAAAVLQLDTWLASLDNRPSLLALQQEITAVLGPYLPNTAAWKNLHKLLTEWLYAALILSALKVTTPPLNLTQVLGLLTRLLLVVALVDTVQQGSNPLQTSDQIYAALRWRTIVLADAIVGILVSVQSQRLVLPVRKPAFADLYITREEWDHYEPAEIASIENILAGEVEEPGSRPR